MPRHEKPPLGGRGESHLAVRARSDLGDELARVRAAVLRTREETLRITADVAETERRLAATLRLVAETAQADGRTRDAQRLARYAAEAQHVAEAEEQRASGG